MIDSRFVEVDGIRTHYLEAGDGPALVLLHGGDPGACGRLTWEYQLAPLAEHFRVIAPDWLGFGETDKLFDFVQPQARRIGHMARFLDAMKLRGAHMAGNSMGGGFLLQTVANRPELFGAKSMTLISGGGALQDGEARRALLTYNGSLAGIEAIVGALYYDRKWLNDEAYVERRHRLSTVPGAWEIGAAPGLTRPAGPKHAASPSEAPRYEDVAIPTMLIAGANDPLRKPGYAPEIANRIPGCELHVFDNCGHFPQIEYAEAVNRLIIDFVRRAESAAPRSDRA
jgi:pimeloyl-ACP methyl ester carboxylesterase